MKEKKILITAGPTKEFIDPVRFISNASTGKMGYAIAEELYKRGADVYLVSGPVNIDTILPTKNIMQINTALEMFEACKTKFASIDIAIFTAAVADYRPKEKSENKIKKRGDEMELILVKNPDIAYEFGKVKSSKQISIGFALETNDIIENAKQKLVKKNFDFIVINSPNKQGEGFGYDTNKISIMNNDEKLSTYDLKTKKEVAIDIINAIKK